MPNEIYVSPHGDDAHNGSMPQTDADLQDGPLLSLRNAVQMARQWRQNGLADGPVTIWLANGRYPMLFPLELGPEDYGVAHFKAMPGARPVLDGGIRLRDWERAKVNGKTAWCADVSRILLEFGPFHSLFANGRRCRRARLPDRDWFWIEEAPDQSDSEYQGPQAFNIELVRGSHRFRAAPGDLESVESWDGADVVMLNRWINERMPVASFDRRTRMMQMTIPTRLCLRSEFADASKTIRYWVENVKEGLSRPGDWYLDQAAARLYYLPLRGQKPEKTEVVVPVARQLVRIRGNVDTLQPAGGLRFEGIHFEYTDWTHPCNRPVHWDPYLPEHAWRKHGGFRQFTETNQANPYKDAGATPQAAFNIPGTIHMEMVNDVQLVDCSVRHVGLYAVGLGQGCRAIQLRGNALSDMGAGGVIMDGADSHSDPRLETGHCCIIDNHIHGGGQVFLAACGIAAINTVQNTIAHNEIHDMTYTGISCGWMWGLRDSVSRLHRIYKNLIYDLGRRGGMSDMGGIYLLGPQPGTFVDGNYIHDIVSAAYGGWGIYPDEGSSFLTIQNNVVLRTGSECMHEHMGRENVIRNNVFLLGGEGGVRFSRALRNRWQDFPGENGMFERNIIVTDGQPMIRDFLAYQEHNPYTFDLNLYWDRKQTEPVFECVVRYGKVQRRKLGSRQRRGADLHSVAANPGLQNMESVVLSLSSRSPARRLGIQAIDMSDVGPRNKRRASAPD